MKKMKCLLLTAALLCTVGVFASCGKTEAAGGEKEYKVTVTDAFGDPYKGVVVQFNNKDGEQEAMQVCDDEGVATKALEAGDYTVALQFTDKEKEYYYDTEGLELSADKTELNITLSYAVPEAKETLVVKEKEYKVAYITPGSGYAKVPAGERTYFYFLPTEPGKYEFSILEGEAEIGYYGSPFYVMDKCPLEIVDNKFVMNIKENMIQEGGGTASANVIGVDATSDSVVIGIKRIGDPDKGIDDIPYQTYKATHTPSKYVLPDGITLKEMDLTKAYNLVLGSDGFYHLDSADGPLVYVNLVQNSKYIDSFKNILANVGVTRVFLDENGECIKKEEYNTCLLEYLACVENGVSEGPSRMGGANQAGRAGSKPGVYPLTEDLKYIIQNFGENSGWFDPEKATYIFRDVNGDKVEGINPDSAWLLMCYIAE